MRQEWLETDYYAVLGVGKEASAADIKKAYRKLARENHPDANAGDDAAASRFKQIGEAYEVLGDEETRKEYDHVREMGYFVGGPGGSQQRVRVEDLFGQQRAGGSPFDLFGGLGDLFGQGAPRPRPGPDYTADLTIGFNDAIAGATKELTLDGRTIKAKIPRGVANGARIKLKGKGGPGANGGPPGDLFIKVKVGKHPIFDRKGARHLTVTVPITFAEATLGADVAVPTLDGTVKLRIPAGTPSGKTFKVSGKGVETGKGTGDLLVTVQVVVPESLTDDQRSLVQQLRDSETGDNPRAHLGVEL